MYETGSMTVSPFLLLLLPSWLLRNSLSQFLCVEYCFPRVRIETDRKKKREENSCSIVYPKETVNQTPKIFNFTLTEKNKKKREKGLCELKSYTQKLECTMYTHVEVRTFQHY